MAHIGKNHPWIELYQHYKKEGLPRDIACVTVAGKKFTRKFVERLLGAGRGSWNRWHDTLPGMQWVRGRPRFTWIPGFICELPGADLRRMDLSSFHFGGCDFPFSKFTRAVLDHASFNFSPQGHVPASDLRGCIFRSINFRGTGLSRANCANSDFSHSLFNGLSLHDTNFDDCIMHKTILAGVFKGVSFRGTDWNGAYLLGSIFTNTNLSQVKNLHAVKFAEPCTIDFATLTASSQLPENFYRGCGFPDILISHLPSLLETPIKMHSCFISYAAKDHQFVERLHADLQRHGVTCFYAPEKLSIGAHIRDTIDKEITTHDKLLLVLSRHSIRSQWVEHEVEAAMERERLTRQNVPFPIMIDNSVFRTDKAWAANLRRQRNIGNFLDWQQTAEYSKAFAQLVRDLGY